MSLLWHQIVKRAMAKIKLEKADYEKAKHVAALNGYATVEEFLVHMINKEVERLNADDTVDESVVDRLRGLGYIE